MNSFSVPILILAWKRVDTLSQLINALRPLRPSNLFIACDGPNPDNYIESQQVLAVRQTFDLLIDWPCHIEKLFSETNQGCRLGVSRAISWFFTYVSKVLFSKTIVFPMQISFHTVNHF